MISENDALRWPPVDGRRHAEAEILTTGIDTVINGIFSFFFVPCQGRQSNPSPTGIYVSFVGKKPLYLTVNRIKMLLSEFIFNALPGVMVFPDESRDTTLRNRNRVLPSVLASCIICQPRTGPLQVD